MQKDQEYLSKLVRLAKNPFLHNDFIYNRLLRSALNYYERTASRAKFLEFKVQWIELEYFHRLTKMIRTLQQFSMHDVIPMKSEVANIFNWYNGFLKYVEGLQLLNYPVMKKRKRQSSQMMDLDRLSSVFSPNRNPVSSSELTGSMVFS